MRYPNDIIRSVLLQYLYDVGRGLYASCHAARNTLLVTCNKCSKQHANKRRKSAKSLDLNPIDHLLDLLERKVRALC